LKTFSSSGPPKSWYVPAWARSLTVSRAARKGFRTSPWPRAGCFGSPCCGPHLSTCRRG
jgi:hypothetical protein